MDTVPPVSTSAQPPVQTNKLSKNPPKKLSGLFLLLLGLGGAIAVVFIIMIVSLNQQQFEDVIPTSPATNPNQALTLTIESPTDGTLAVEDELLVRGTTLPITTVAIFTETDETIVESDAAGLFETTVQLTAGINSLTITAYGADGQEKSTNLTIVYDKET